MLKLGIILAVVAVFHVAQAERQYRLFTVTNRQEPVNMSRSDSFLPNEFKQEDKTIILIHGHGGGVGHEFNTLIIRELFEFQGAFNAIVVDWENEARHSYSTAVSYVPLLANELSEFITWLVAHGNCDGSGDNSGSGETGGSEENTPPTVTPGGPENDLDRTSACLEVDVSKLHLVGFGLGAHIAGMASRQLEKKVGRITGLNPDGRGWEVHTSGHLRRTDADYVEVIHTDGLGLPHSCSYANGIGTGIGDVNFYVNGGSSQPGCFSHSCSHNRAYELFAASLSNNNLVGYPCRFMTQMNINRCNGDALHVGDTNTDKITGLTAASVYRINTRESWPF